MASSEFNWDDEEFDDTFFQEVDKLEELATSLTQKPHPPKPSSSASFYPPPPQPPPQPSISGASFNNFSYSPPRELSQRVPQPNGSNDSRCSGSTRFGQSPVTQEQLQIEKLKNELCLVSKQLSDLKQECSELRNERDMNKNKQLKSACSNTEASAWNSEALAQIGVSRNCDNAGGHVSSQINVAEQKSIGIQTDKGDESSMASTSGVTSAYFGNPELLSIWCLRSRDRSGRNFVAKLFETCTADFCFLFRFLSSNMTSKVEIEHLSLVSFPGNVQGLHSAEVAKLSQLYSVLTQLSDGVVCVNALVEKLLDLCSIDNVLVARRSLHILHVALDHLLCMNSCHTKRDNVKVERYHSGSHAAHNHDSAVRRFVSIDDVCEADASGSHYTTARKLMGDAEHENIPLLYHVDWLLLFQSTCQIAVRMTEENVRMEAVSVMNLILMTTDAYSEREKFGGTVIFEALAILLRKQAGLLCRKEAVHLLYLLLNCPNLLATFCSSYRGTKDHTESPNHGVKSPSFQASSDILEGLADCIVGCDRGVKELVLCRNALTVLAFLASYGKLGLEIFLFHRLPKRTNFLGLVLQLLVSEADVDAFKSCPEPEVSKERKEKCNWGRCQRSSLNSTVSTVKVGACV